MFSRRMKRASVKENNSNVNTFNVIRFYNKKKSNGKYIVYYLGHAFVDVTNEHVIETGAG